VEWGNGEVVTVDLEWIWRSSWYRPTAKGKHGPANDLVVNHAVYWYPLGLLEVLCFGLFLLPPWTRRPRSIGKLVHENGVLTYNKLWQTQLMFLMLRYT
jgi:hypothetical protein